MADAFGDTFGAVADFAHQRDGGAAEVVDVQDRVMMRVLFAIVVAITGPPLLPIQLPLRSGWHSGTPAAHACPGVAATRCSEASSLAATVRWRDCSECLLHHTLASLPLSGIAIQVSLVRERPVTAQSALIYWPGVRDHRHTAHTRLPGVLLLPGKRPINDPSSVHSR